MLPTPSNTTIKGCVPATHNIVAIDHSGKRQELSVVGEVPLTLKVDGFEIVRIMTLGNHPKALALGYLRNQGLIEKIEEIDTVTVDWETEIVNVVTRKGAGIGRHQTRLTKPTVLALEIAQDMGPTVIGRAKGMRHLLYNGAENIIFDAIKTDKQN